MDPAIAECAPVTFEKGGIDHGVDGWERAIVWKRVILNETKF